MADGTAATVVDEDEVAGLRIRDPSDHRPLRRRGVRQVDADLVEDVRGEAGAVETVGADAAVGVVGAGGDRCGDLEHVGRRGAHPLDAAGRLGRAGL